MNGETSSAPKAGSVFETVFWRNEGALAGAFPFRATHVGGVKSSKVILCSDKGIEAGRLCRVRVRRVKRPQSSGRGMIEVEYLGRVEFQLSPDIYLDKKITRKLQILLEAGYSILLDGPQGSGKTVLSRSIADALDMKYIYFNCASVYEATDFIATLQVRASESGGAETVFIPTNFCTALRDAAENPAGRFLVFLDEFNRCRPMARNGLMPALDSTRRIYDPATNTLLDIPDNVQFVAAINNGAQFVGATAVDPAQMDRFATLKLDYPPPEEEEKLLARRFPDLDRSRLGAVVAVADALRKDEQLGVDLSMRATQEACALLSHPIFAEDTDAGPALRDVLETSFAGRFPGRIEDESSDAALVWQVIIRALRSCSGKFD